MNISELLFENISDVMQCILKTHNKTKIIKMNDICYEKLN